MTLSVFLGGPIQHATSGAQFYTPLKRDLEAAIAQLREEGHRVFSAHLDEAFGAMEADFTPERVSRRDFGWMQACQVYAAILPRGPDGRLMRTDGTHIEIGWASALQIPIVLFVEAGCRPELSFLVQGLHTVATITIHEFDPRTGCDPVALAAQIGRVNVAPKRKPVGVTVTL
jgi:nucleoside 2-deoxyribosyltransferase